MPGRRGCGRAMGSARAAAPAPEPSSVTRSGHPSRQGIENVRERRWHVGGTVLATLRGRTRRVHSTGGLKGTAMHIKGVLLALAVATRVAVLVPAFALAWLSWQR